MLLECPITAELFQKNGYDLNVYNNVKDTLYNTDVITNIVKSIAQDGHLDFHTAPELWSGSSGAVWK